MPWIIRTNSWCFFPFLKPYYLRNYHLPQGGSKPVVLRACLHGGGGPQVGEVTHLGGVTRLYRISHFNLITFPKRG